MKSCLYRGQLSHRRFFPKAHDFKYPVLLFYIDLDEVSKIFSIPLFFSARAPRFLGFERSDYLRGQDDLKETVKDFVQKQTGKVLQGPIRLLTQIRYFGFCFNPVSFFYCFDPSDQHVEAIVAEITNTPWNERKAYVIPIQERGKMVRTQFDKNFHISPFMPMNLQHTWTFSLPMPGHSAGNAESNLTVYMEDRLYPNLNLIFDATLELKPIPLTAKNLLVALIQFPLLTFKSFIAIYLQALILKLKGVPFYPHPGAKL